MSARWQVYCCYSSHCPTMWNRNMYVTLLTFSVLVECTVSGLNWGGNCSIPCTCDLSHFADLPITNRWLSQEPSDEPSRPETDGNQATYDDETPRGDLLKTAMCMLQQDTQLQALLAKLPEDIQVLTILQGRTSGELALEADYLRRFRDLTVLDVQGFPPERDQPSDPLILRNDALRPLTRLQYLNLEHVKLLGHQGGNQIESGSRPAELSSPSRAGRKQKPRLVFLEPADNEIPLVPYSEYKQEMDREGLTTFAGLPALVFLRVFSCNLREVTWEMFEGLDALQHLSLERNDLLFVPDFAFYGTPHLVSLSLAGNKLLSMQDTALAGLFELEKLDLSSNNFSHLSELSLPPFPKLRVADFRSNPVEAVFPSTFEIMNATHVLHLGGDGSPLDLLANSFLGLSSLRTLTVANARVPVLERQLLRGMPELVALQMTGDIPAVTFDAFLEVPKLQRLDLRRCHIAAISMDAFYGLRGLVSLDLSTNSLAALPPGVFDQQVSLRELMLQDNRLTALPVGLLAHLPAKMIRLDRNPWHCSCDMRGWQAAAINRVKQRGVIAGTACQFAYDKGSMCRQTAPAERYVYDKRVEPRCATPDKYKDWNVFHLLRKELQCAKHKRKNAAYGSVQKSIKQEEIAYKLREMKNVIGTASTAINTTSNAYTQQDPKPEKLPEPVLMENGSEPETLSKKARQKLELQKEMDEKIALKETAKTDQDTLMQKGIELDILTKNARQQLEMKKELDEKTVIKQIAKSDQDTLMKKGNEPDILTKKARQQLEMKKELDGKTVIKQIAKSDKVEFTKTLYNLDLAKKRQEKLKQIQP